MGESLVSQNSKSNASVNFDCKLDSTDKSCGQSINHRKMLLAIQFSDLWTKKRDEKLYIVNA